MEDGKKIGRRIRNKSEKIIRAKEEYREVRRREEEEYDGKKLKWVLRAEETKRRKIKD